MKTKPNTDIENDIEMKTTQTLTLHLKLNVYKVGFLKQVIYGEYHLWITSLSSISGTLHLVFFTLETSPVYCTAQ